MKASIEITQQYGFAHYWTLVLTKGKQRKSFYLGQDVKFCKRVLGMDPGYIVQQIGTRDISSPQGNRKLANFIVDTLGLENYNVMDMDIWGLCSE